MLYSISVSANIGYTHKVVEAEDEDAARVIARTMEEEKRKEITPELVTIRSNISLSDENFIYTPKAIYLISRYRKFYPAVCIRSHRTWKCTKFEHVFKFLDTRKHTTLYGKKPNKVGKKLCEDGKIAETKCDNCPAKFMCYTVK